MLLPLAHLLALFVPGVAAADSFGSEMYYFGDLHAHTGYSGDGGSSDLTSCPTGCGAFADVFDIAKANGLDFVALIDHSNGTVAQGEDDFLTALPTILAANDEAGGFITIAGAEVWFYDNLDAIGHKTLMMFGDNDTLSPLTLDEVRPNGTSPHLTSGMGCTILWSWADTLASTYGDILLLPHHPATKVPIGTDWTCHDERYEPAVEAYSRHGSSLNADDAWDIPYKGVTESGYITEGLDPDGEALQMGFFGGTDEHDTTPGETCELDLLVTNHKYGGGLTGLVLDESETLSRSTIYQALSEHRTYTTTGPHFTMALDWSARGVSLGGLGTDAELILGDDLSLTVSLPVEQAAYVVEVKARGPDGDWVLDDNGDGTWSVTIPGAEVPAYVYASVEVDGLAYYGEGGCSDGGDDDKEFLWSSPSYWSFVDDDEDGDGVNVIDGDCDDADATIFPGATELAYDGVDQDCDEASDYDLDADGHDADLFGGEDCDDDDATVFPGASELAYDGVDSDCAADSDYDADADGYDADSFGGDDCDDGDTTVFPGATELAYDGVDSDCSTDSDYDFDGDGFEVDLFGGDDCDDADATVFPGADDSPGDGVDQDCDDSDPLVDDGVIGDTGFGDTGAAEAVEGADDGADESSDGGWDTGAGDEIEGDTATAEPRSGADEEIAEDRLRKWRLWVRSHRGLRN